MMACCSGMNDEILLCVRALKLHNITVQILTVYTNLVIHLNMDLQPSCCPRWVMVKLTSPQIESVLNTVLTVKRCNLTPDWLVIRSAWFLSQNSATLLLLKLSVYSMLKNMFCLTWMSLIIRHVTIFCDQKHWVEWFPPQYICEKIPSVFYILKF